MQITLILYLIFSVALTTSFITPASTTENFNSRKGTPLKKLKGQLQNSCWTFHHFDVNNAAWNPAIEGDGAMVSSSSALNANNSGIYTPLLQVRNRLDVSFDYRFNENFDATTIRWLKICLANTANEILQVLEEVELNGVNGTSIKNYSTEFRNIHPGEYRLVLLYGGKGGNASIAIDELATSAPYKFVGGCSGAPVAQKIIIKGTGERKASGSLHADGEISSEDVSAFLVKDAENGRVIIEPDGTFVFIPDAGFRGKSTGFVQPHNFSLYHVVICKVNFVLFCIFSYKFFRFRISF